jgi:colicin import membrane protein
MKQRPSSYNRYLMWVSGVHAAVIATVLLASFAAGLWPAPPRTDMTELMIEIPSDLAGESSAPPDPAPEPPKPEPPKPDEVKPPTPPDPDEIPAPAPPKIKPDVKKPPDKKPEPRKPVPIKVSTTKIKKLNMQPTSNRRTKLTADEIRRALERGAKPGAHSSLSDADIRRLLSTDMKFGEGSPITQELLYLELIRQTMYKAWNQPASLGVAGLVTKMGITLQPDGSVVGNRIIASSGNRVMDESVVRAVSAVRRITGIPSGFLAQHRNVTVLFELTGN